MSISNATIRKKILDYINQYGPQDTCKVIDLFARKFGTTKQRISGNISCMACIERSITITPNRPHSIMM